MVSPATVPARELSSIDFSSMIGGPLRAVIEAQAQAAMSSVEFIKAVGFMPADPEQVEEGPTAAEPIYVSFRYPKETKPYEPAVPAAILGVTVANGGDYPTATDGDTQPVTFSGGGGSNAAATATISGNKVVSVRLDDPGTGYTSAPTATVTGAGSGGTNATLAVQFQSAVAASPAEYQEMELEVPILTMLPVPFIRVEEATIDFNAKINSVEHSTTNTSFKAGTELRYKYGASANASVPLKVVSIGAKVSSSVDFKVSASYQRNTTSGYKVDRTYSLSVHVRAVQDEMPAGLERLLGILEDSIQSTPVEA